MKVRASSDKITNLTVISNSKALQGPVFSPSSSTPQTSMTAATSATVRSILMTQQWLDHHGWGWTSNRTVVDNCVIWSERNQLQLNVTKTEKLVVDLRRTKAAVTSTSVQWDGVEVMEEYKHLEVCLDNKLDWRQVVPQYLLDDAQNVLQVLQLHHYAVCRGCVGGTDLTVMLREDTLPFWILPQTHSTMCWGAARAHSAKECYFHAAQLNHRKSFLPVTIKLLNSMVWSNCTLDIPLLVLYLSDTSLEVIFYFYVYPKFYSKIKNCLSQKITLK